MALRYQRQSLYSERAGVKTHEGIDPLTGLPVLLYEFAGKPDPALADLESENIPGILDTHQEGARGQVVVAYSKGYTPASKPLKMPAIMFLLESARALKDAAQAGVIHGDLRPERFLISGDHVLVEGFGIPWTPEPSPYSPPEGVANYAGDIYAYAKVMLELVSDWTQPVRTLLERCLARKPEDRPSAAQLLASLRSVQRQPQAAKPQEVKEVQPPRPTPQTASAGAVTPVIPASAPTPPVTSGQVLEIDFTVSDDVATPPVSTPPPVAKTAVIPDLELFPETPVNTPAPPLKQPVSFDNWDDETDPMVLDSDHGRPPVSSSSSKVPTFVAPTPKPLESKPKSKKGPDDPKQTFIKDLPPGGTYRVGKSTEPSAPISFKETPVPPTFDEVFLKGSKNAKNSRRIFMVVSLIVLALVLAGIVFLNRNDNNSTTPTQSSAVSYIVSVNVEPSNLPPLDLLVVSGPANSKFRAGAVVSKVPGQIVLDQAGTWQFQARFQEVVSQPITLQLPEQRSITVTMPALLPPEEGEETPEDGTNPEETPSDTPSQ